MYELNHFIVRAITSYIYKFNTMWYNKNFRSKTSSKGILALLHLTSYFYHFCLVNLWWCYQIKSHISFPLDKRKFNLYIMRNSIYPQLFFYMEWRYWIVNIPRQIKKFHEILPDRLSHIFLPEYYFINFDIWMMLRFMNDNFIARIS